MGQKVHPESLRVGYIHDWKSNWFSEKQFSDYLDEDVRIRDHITGKLAHAGLSDITIRKDAAEEWAGAEHVHLFTHFQMLDPVKNTQAGTWYLRKLLWRYAQTDNPLPYALADYNAGRTHVLQWNKGAAATNSIVFMAQITYPSTRKYVQSVVERYRHYRPIFPPGRSRSAAPVKTAFLAEADEDLQILVIHLRRGDRHDLLAEQQKISALQRLGETSRSLEPYLYLVHCRLFKMRKSGGTDSISAQADAFVGYIVADDRADIRVRLEAQFERARR